MKRYAFPLTIILLLFAVIALAAPGDKRPAVTSAAIGLGTSSSPTLASITATTSVTAPAYNSTAADGYHYILPYNSTAFAGTPLVGMMQTTPTGPQWYTGSAWEAIGSGGGGTWGSITGTLSAQADLQAALDAISAGGITISTAIPTTAGASYLNDTTHVLTVASTTGYTQFTGSFTAWDTTPAAFAFTDETDVTADGGQSCGAAITVAGINYATAISATGDTGYGYKINGGAFTNASGTVALNDSVAPCVNRSSNNSTATTAIITIGGVSDTYSVTTEAGSASYLINQNFENTGASGFDNGETWTPGTSGTATINSMYTTSPGRGIQSVYVSAGNNIATINSPVVTNMDTMYGHFMFYTGNVAPSANTDIMEIRGVSGGILGHVQLRSPGRITLYSGGNAKTGTFNLANNTWYHVWFEITKGTGSNGTYKTWVSATNSKPETPDTSGTDGQLTSQLNTVRITAANGINFVMDQVIINNAEIGNAP